MPVDPDTMQSDCGGVHACISAWQIANSALWAAANSIAIKQYQVCVIAREKAPAMFDAANVGWSTSDGLHRLLEGHITAVARPVSEQMSTQSGVAQKGQVRPRRR